MDIFLIIIFPLVFIGNGLILGKIISYYKSWSFMNSFMMGILLYIAYWALISIVFSIVPYTKIDTYLYLLLAFQLIICVFYLVHIKFILSFNIMAINLKNLGLFFIFFSLFLLISCLYLKFNFSSNFVKNETFVLLTYPNYHSSGLNFTLNAYHLSQLFIYYPITNLIPYLALTKYSFNILICFIYALLFTLIYNKANHHNFSVVDLLPLFFYALFIVAIETITFILTNNSISANAWICLYLLLLIYALDQLHNDEFLARYLLFGIFVSSTFFIHWFYFITIAVFIILIPILKQQEKFNVFKFFTYLFCFLSFNILLSFLSINNVSVDVVIFLFICFTFFVLLITWNRTFILLLHKINYFYLQNVRYFILSLYTIFIAIIFCFFIFYSLKVSNNYFYGFQIISLFDNLNLHSSLNLWITNVLFWIISFFIELVFLISFYKFQYENKILQKTNKFIYQLIFFASVLLWNPLSANLFFEGSILLKNSLQVEHFVPIFFYLMIFLWIIYYFLLNNNYIVNFKNLNNRIINENAKI